ncbi:MAG: polysaccharide deacetylase family protein [Thiomonas sp.]|jgi:peptidoglycan/xylan/chitin deacetylase (PgdA/CDA1 family)
MRKLLATAFLPQALLRNAWQPGLRILMYHRIASVDTYDQLTVSPARFAQQMQELARHAVVSLEQGLQALQSGSLRAPLFAVTFDDGYLDNLTEALPVLQHYRIPATIFVTARFCDQTMSHPRYRNPSGQRLHLNWDEVRQLASTPGITIGSHTLTHPYLPTLTEDAAQQEIAASRSEIAAHLHRSVDLFCYPSGDLSARELTLVQQAGYAAAVSVAPGVNHRHTNRFALRRTEITDRDDPPMFRLKLAGAFDPIHQVLHAQRTRRFARRHFKPSPTLQTKRP